MLRPHVILVDQVVSPRYSLGKIIHSPRVSLITLAPRLYSVVILILSAFPLDAWHVPLRHQSYPLGLGHHVVQHSASTAGAAAYLAYA